MPGCAITVHPDFFHIIGEKYSYEQIDDDAADGGDGEKAQT